MGNSLSSSLQVSQSLAPEWIQQESLGYCSLLTNMETQEKAEQYIFHTIRPIEQEMQIYEYRHHQKSNLVRVISVQKSGTGGFCNNSIQLLVTIQHIPKRLSQVKNIRFQQCISIIRSALIGYKTIFEREGYLKVTDEMIGFTKDNNVKVWLNQNFSNNHNEQEYEDAKNSAASSTMITEIIKLIQSHSSKSLSDLLAYFPNYFSKNCSFTQAISIMEQYIKARNIKIPEKLSLQPPSQIQSRVDQKVVISKMPRSAFFDKNNQILSSSVFPVNIKQPDITKTLMTNKNTSIVKDSQMQIKYHTPIKVLKHVKSDSSLLKPSISYGIASNSRLIKNQFVKLPMNVPNPQQRKFTSPPIFSRGSPNLSINQLKTSVQQSISRKQHRFISPEPFSIKSKLGGLQLASKVQQKKSNTTTSSPINEISSTSEFPVFKLKYKKQKISKFSSNLHKLKQSQSPIRSPERSWENHKFQTTGGFGNFQIIQDSISDLTSSQSNRLRPIIPPLKFSSNLDFDKESQQIVVSMKNLLDDVSITKQTVVLVDKTHREQISSKSINQSICCKSYNSLNQICINSSIFAESIHKNIQQKIEQKNATQSRNMFVMSFGSKQNLFERQNNWINKSNVEVVESIVNHKPVIKNLKPTPDRALADSCNKINRTDYQMKSPKNGGQKGSRGDLKNVLYL